MTAPSLRSWPFAGGVGRLSARGRTAPGNGLLAVPAARETFWAVGLNQAGVRVMNEATKEGIERYKAAIERIRSGESNSEEVELPSGRVRLTPEEGGPTGINIEVLEGGQAGTERVSPTRRCGRPWNA